MPKAGEISKLRLLLYSISEELTTDDLASLKFLCDGHLTRAKLEKIDNAKQLFVSITEVIEGEEEQLKFLIQLFETIGRRDLKAKLEKFQNSRQGEVRDAEIQELNVNDHVDDDGFIAPSPDPTGNDPIPQDFTGNGPIPQDSIGNYPIPQDSLQNDPIPQDSIGNYPILQDSTGNHPIPQDFTGNGPVPQDSIGNYPMLQDSTGNHPIPQDFTGNGPIPQDSVGNYPILQDSTGNHSIPQDFTGNYPISYDPTGNHPIPHDPTGNHPIPPHCTRNDSIPFGQQVTEDMEHLNNKIESAAKLSEFSNWGYSPTCTNDQNPKVPNEVVESRDQPDKGSQNIPSGRPMISTSTTSATSSSQLPTFVEPQQKVPVERCMSTDFSETSSQCFHQKCPVEMSYDGIKRFFQHGEGELGKGGFGVVYEGNCKFHGQDVVVKEEYSAHVGQAYSAAQLKREKRVGYIKHPHLMPLYAFSEEKGKPCCLMYPKMYSDLSKALHKDSKGRQKLPWENRVRIALHTARALQYLHKEVKNERNVRQEIVHMDVKPGNIFLDRDLNARLGDPGMSQELPLGYSFASISQTRGTEGYLDAYMNLESHWRPINDIFSFGVVLLQLLVQRKAVEETSQNKKVLLHRVLKEQGVLSDPEILMGKAKEGVWPDSGDDRNYTKEFASIAIDCLKQPNERAKLPDICKRLQKILETKKVAKASKPKEAGARCVSCLLNPPAKYLAVRSSGCDDDHSQDCNYFCVTCLAQSRRNPLECPCHGLAEPLIGGSNTYAVLICGNDSSSSVNAAIFERDLFKLENVLTDSRIIGVRRDHMYCIKPSTSDVSQAAKIRQNLLKLKQDLEEQGKKDVFLYFYFSGHSDPNGNLICSSGKDVLTEAELKKHLHSFKENVSEFLIILDCCYADGKIASEHLENEAFLVHKSHHPAEKKEAPRQLPLESLCSSLDDSGDCKASDHEDLISIEAEQCTDFDTIDGNVICKSPAEHFTVRQWSSSLSQQESYAKKHGNSFLTEYIIRGLRGAHSCPFAKNKPNCSYCDTFKVQAKSVGYISAANLEVFISKHVKLAASKAKGMRQSPRIRSLHSDETILAYYNEEDLHNEIMFKSATGSSKRITVDMFPLTLVDFQKKLFDKLEGNLPNGTQPKHLQILCDDEEIVQNSYVDLMDFIRQGYDVKCQLRPCISIVYGPVVLEIQNYRELVINLLSVLGLKSNQDMSTFEVDTTNKSYAEEDLKDCFEDNPNLRNLKGTPLANSIHVILSTAYLSPGHLTICVQDDSLDCSFIKH